MESVQNVNLPKLRQAQFDIAKAWQSGATVCGLVILLINIIVTVTSQLSTLLAVTAIVLTVLHALLLWQSDRLRGEAEATLRKLEFYDGLGWAITKREIADLLASASKAVKQAAYSTEICPYWASEQLKSPMKLLGNLEESAWWSKHLARRMSRYAGAAGLVTFVVVLITLILALQSPAAQPSANLIAKVTILIVLFVISGGYVRLAFDYNQFAQQAEQAETRAVQLQQAAVITDIEAVKLVHDYQIARAASPLLPSWLWNRVKAELNELWDARVAVEKHQ